MQKEADMNVSSNSVTGVALNAMNSQEVERQKELKKIASGVSVSSTDGANLATFDMLQSSSAQLLQGVQNGNDAVGFMQTADTALQSVNNGAQQLNVLSVAMNNASLNSQDQAALSAQATNVQASMSQAISGATFNGNSVFGNSSFNIGSGSINVNIQQPNVSGLDINNQSSITDFMNQTNQTRANVGSAVNQTFAGIKNNLSTVNNQQASASQIGDTDIATAVAALNQTLLQTNASAYALAHNQDYLGKQASRLLGA